MYGIAFCPSPDANTFPGRRHFLIGSHGLLHEILCPYIDGAELVSAMI